MLEPMGIKQSERPHSYMLTSKRSSGIRPGVICGIIKSHIQIKPLLKMVKGGKVVGRGNLTTCSDTLNVVPASAECKVRLSVLLGCDGG